jgi:hypothetical protein
MVYECVSKDPVADNGLGTDNMTAMLLKLHKFGERYDNTKFKEELLKKEKEREAERKARGESD